MTAVLTRRYRDMATMLATSLVAGYLFMVFDLPVPWLLGPIAGGIALASFSRRRLTFPRPAVIFAQVVLALSTGLRFTPELLATLGSNLVYILAINLVTMVLAMGMGYLLWRWAGVDRTSGFLGSVPAMATGMVAMAGDLGADPRLVAVIQYWRLLLVVVLAPFAITHLPFIQAAATAANGGAGAADASARGIGAVAGAVAGAAGGADPVASLAILGSLSSLGWPGSVVVAIAVGLAGWWLGPRLRLPSPNFLGPLLLTLAVTWSGLAQFRVPHVAILAAMMFLGINVGVQFDARTLARLGKVTVLEAALVVVLMATCGVSGYLLHRVTGIDLITSLLATTPGGFEAMTATALESNANAPMVVSIQLVRVLGIMVVGPYVAMYLASQKPSLPAGG